MKKIQKAFMGMLLGTCVIMSMPMEKVNASSTMINERQDGNTEVIGNGDMDVEINLKDDEKQPESSTDITNSNSTVTKPSTNDVGKGLGDKVSQNAKTGDIFSGKNITILLIATGAVLVIVGIKKKKTVED